MTRITDFVNGKVPTHKARPGGPRVPKSTTTTTTTR